MVANRNNLHEINVVRPDEETIALVRRLLAKCESGEVQKVLVATINRERVCGSAFSGELEVREAAYALKLLELRINDLIRLQEQEAWSREENEE